MGIGKVISERPEYFSSTAPSYLYSLSEYENRYYAQVHFDIVSFYKPLFSADYLRAKFRRLNYFSGYGGSSGYISRTINEEVRKLITNKILRNLCKIRNFSQSPFGGFIFEESDGNFPSGRN